MPHCFFTRHSPLKPPPVSRGKLAEIKQQLRQRMHEPVAETGKWLKSVVQGYFNYHAVPGNTDTVRVFRYRVTRLWRQAARGAT